MVVLTFLMNMDDFLRCFFLPLACFFFLILFIIVILIVIFPLFIIRSFIIV